MYVYVFVIRWTLNWLNIHLHVLNCDIDKGKPRGGNFKSRILTIVEADPNFSKKKKEYEIKKISAQFFSIRQYALF